MNPRQISTADCLLIRMETARRRIALHFAEIYHLESGAFVPNVCLSIADWQQFAGTAFRRRGPLSGDGDYASIPFERIEPFESVQSWQWQGSTLTLAGFGKHSGSWLSYSFAHPVVRVEPQSSGSLSL
ncbi:hypothetical protein H9Q10_09715 [Eikenella sp. S3360]|uniref:Uncharacterized protein n=1 Tax=Eikenella glucosivorans TaxID=2766967 RepID=A0ABS0NCB7_9NEIS|nr:hypothetical protein [Eikenella glucosivorans]MBH5329941.1 hypothetical protein [Eikenella glucosivorans]